jgi:hypothetical protein
VPPQKYSKMKTCRSGTGAKLDQCVQDIEEYLNVIDGGLLGSADDDYYEETEEEADEITVQNLDLDLQVLEDIDNFTKKRSEGKRKAKPRKKRSKNEVRDREKAVAFLNDIPEGRFKRMFRVTKATFAMVLDRIRPMIGKRCGLKNNENNSKMVIPPELKLAATLRWLAGGSYLDIAPLYSLSIESFHHPQGPLWPTIEAINQQFSFNFDVSDKDKLEECSLGFYEMSKHRLEGCVMALDGLVVQVKLPSDVDNQVSYRNRKGCFALVVLAGCDHACRFTYVNASCPGSSNDQFVWNLCELNHRIQQGQMPGKYFIIADEGLVCTNYLLTPYSGRRLSVEHDSWNYHLSALRQCIERAFGILVKRWGIFWRPFEFDMVHWATVVSVCMKLHNICVTENGTAEELDPFEHDFCEGDDREPIFNDDCDVAEQGESQKRRVLSALLHSQGYLRPDRNNHSKV